MRGIVVAGTHSGCGKTTVTLGLLAALKKKGLTVQAFKAGPDFIDTGIHKLITKRASRNLDIWMCGKDYVRNCFITHSRTADISVVEGVMGLYDGNFSTAVLADTLGLPVILVVDAYGMAESAGAVVKGFTEFGMRDMEYGTLNPKSKIQNPKSLICGVIFNRVGSLNHYNRLKSSVHDLPVFGYLPRDSSFEIPHRHLGLMVAEEDPLTAENIDRLADTVIEHIDVDEIIRTANNKTQGDNQSDSHGKKNPVTSYRASKFKYSPPLRGGDRGEGEKSLTNHPHLTSPLKGEEYTINLQQAAGNCKLKPKAQDSKLFKIAVAYDKAFCFYYEDNLDLLRDAGAEIVTFSPISDSSIPDNADAIYIGGGYPELYASELSENVSMMEAIHAWADSGRPVYAECGGLMYLSQGILDHDGILHKMSGVFPFETIMNKKRTRLGYRELMLKEDCILGKKGDIFKGHEFHYSEIRPGISSQQPATAYSVKDGYGENTGDEGFKYKNTLASYIHIHFGSNKDAAKYFVDLAKQHFQ